MASVHILHIADCHLDCSFAAAGLTPEFARQRTGEVKEAFAAALAAGRQAGAQVVLIAGDLFEARCVRLGTVRWVAERLAELDLPVFIAPGNHDPLQPGSCYDAVAWPDNVRIFGPRWESMVLPDLGVEVRGYGFYRYELTDPVLAAIPAPARPHLVQLVVLHGSLVQSRVGATPAAGAAGLTASDAPLGWREAPYLPFTEADLAAARADYVALGHYHRHMPAWRDGGRLALYPGPPESLDFGDRGDHGAVVGTVEKGRADVRLVRVGRREHVTVDCDVTGSPTLESIAALVRACAPDGDRRLHLHRVRLTGLLDPALELDLAELRRALAPEFVALRLVDDTQPDFDLPSLAAEHGVRGAFVRRMQRLLDERGAAGDAEGAAAALAALRAGLSALRGQPPAVRT